MGKSKAPEYAITTVTTGGLFGDSTSSKSGTTYNPNQSMKDVGDIAWGGLGNTLTSLGSNDYANDPNFQAYQNQLNKTMTQNYDTSVLSQLANRNLMRSSGLQAATNAFADTLANQTTDLYDSYYNRLSNNLSNYQNTLNNLYSYITGLNSQAMSNSQGVSNYNMEGYKADQAAKAQLYGSLAQAAGSIAAAPMTGGTSIAGTVASNALKK